MMEALRGDLRVCFPGMKPNYGGGTWSSRRACIAAEGGHSMHVCTLACRASRRVQPRAPSAWRKLVWNGFNKFLNSMSKHTTLKGQPTRGSVSARDWRRQSFGDSLDIPNTRPEEVPEQALYRRCWFGVEERNFVDDENSDSTGSKGSRRKSRSRSRSKMRQQSQQRLQRRHRQR